MARSRRAPKRKVTTFDSLLESLPERFRTPEVSEDLLGSLRDYLADLEQWLASEGIKPDDTRAMALDIMSVIGTSPSEWYRRHAEDSA